MSRARIDKLQALLKRVEERRAAPRLHAVPAVAAIAPVAAVVAQVELARAVSAPPVAPIPTLPAPVAPLPVSIAPAPTVPPAADAPRKPPSASPLEDAMAQLDPGGSGPLEISSLAEPITLSSREPSAPRPLPQDLMLTHRPEAGPEFEPPIELVQPRKPAVEREPTIEFETAKVRVSPRELRAIGESPAESRAAPQAAPEPLTAPSQVLESAPLSPAAAPMRVVSHVRSEAPKSFGELLDLSLALRPTTDAKG